MKKKTKGEKTSATIKVKAKYKIRYTDRIDEQIEEIKSKRVTNVYNADYKAIDDTIDEIKKVSRKVSTNDYATNNVYLILQDALKKVVAAEK